MKNLDWEDAFAIFAHSDIALLRLHYKTVLRKELSPTSQAFWDAHVNNNFNFMYSGTSGHAAWVLVFIVLPVLGLGFIRRLVKAGVSKVRQALSVLCPSSYPLVNRSVPN